MPILRIENPRAMLTAVNIRLESGCEDKYLSLHRPPPNPYLLGGGGWKRWSHFIKVKRTNICYCREQLCSKSILLRPKKENDNFCSSLCKQKTKQYWIFDQYYDEVMLFGTGWLFWRVDVFLRSCLFNNTGHPWKPSCLCSGKCVWPSATPPPTSIPKHPTLFFTFGLLHFLILASHKIW